VTRISSFIVTPIFSLLHSQRMISRADKTKQNKTKQNKTKHILTRSWRIVWDKKEQIKILKVKRSLEDGGKTRGKREHARERQREREVG